MVICTAIVLKYNNPLTYVLSSAKLDATGHRRLAALGSYDFKLMYRCGRANGDAGGLSRRSRQTTELCPDAVKAICQKAICQAYMVKRDSCPYFETLDVSSASGVVEPRDSPA